MVISYCLAIYDRSIREQPIRPAGRLDMYMATYLPYGDIFVSCDPGQIASLKIVAEEAKLGVSVLSFEEFELR